VTRVLWVQAARKSNEKGKKKEMTPREIIKRNVEFSGPDRIGFAFSDGRLNDFCIADISPSNTWNPRKWVEGDIEYYDDEWGNIWHRLKSMSKGGEIYRPAIEDWSHLKEYTLPALADPGRYQHAKEIFENNNEHYHLANLPGFPFAICRYLRKMEIYFQDLVNNREHIDYLHDKVTSLLEEMIRQYAQAAGTDGVFFCEDWGIQDRLLISPNMWREIYKPLYKRLCDVAHSEGIHVFMHSCGYNWLILDDLAEVGVNVFQFDQPNIYDITRLAEKLKHLRVCLFSPVDIQTVLPKGNRELIENEARKMVELFGGAHGGLIVKNYGDLQGVGVQPEWDQWAYEMFVNHKESPIGRKNHLQPLRRI